MSKAVKKIAGIALPIVGNYLLPGIGGAIGGALGGYISSGSLTGAALGAVTGYASGGVTNGIIGQAAHTLPAGVAGPVTSGSGIMGAVTGGGFKALGQTVSNAASGVANAVTGAASGSDTAKWLMGVGNQVVAGEAAETAQAAADAQNKGLKAAAAQQAPYQQLGKDAVNQINQIQQDPAGYIQNNSFYNTLAADAERRLTAGQAANGKAYSGGTKAELQNQLLQVGNNLVNQDINRLQTQANLGSGAATNVSNMNTQMGMNDAAGMIGANNRMSAGYQNQIDTLLALNTPKYQPAQMYSR